jgi:hypothetical protein
MAHSPNLSEPAAVANVKGAPSSDAAISTLSVPALLTEEVQTWIERVRAAEPKVTKGMLMLELATALGVVERQVYRYMSGETPLPLEQAATVCRTLRSWRLLALVNQDAGLLAEPRPDAAKLEGFDVVIEQSRNFREFSELTAAYAAAMDRPPSTQELQRIEIEAAEAIQQITRLVRIYRELAVPTNGRRPPAKAIPRQKEFQA